MPDNHKEGLARFANFLQRSRIESQMTEAFEDLHGLLTDLKTTANELEEDLSDVLFGDETVRCSR